MLLCGVAGKRAFVSGIEGKSVWHSSDTCELMTLWRDEEKWKNRLICSLWSLMKHPQDTLNGKKCVFCLLSLFSKSQYWSKDYWLGVNALLFCPALLFSLHLLHGLASHYPAHACDEFIFSKIHWDWNTPPSPIKSLNPSAVSSSSSSPAPSRPIQAT